MIKQKVKLNIHEIIEPYNFSLEKTKVPDKEYMLEYGLDEDDVNMLEDDIGKSCFILWDKVIDEIRGIYLNTKITGEMCLEIIDNLSAFIEDSTWDDVLDTYIKKEDIKKLNDFTDVFNYLNSHDTGISEWYKTFIEVLATGNPDLFEELEQ